MTEDRRKNDNYVSGQMDVIKDMLSDHIRQSRKEREEMREELSEIKTEITKYKYMARTLGAIVFALLTLKIGDLPELWKSLF
jgi:hypothetical protein